MFILTQDGKNMINTDAVAGFDCNRGGSCVIARMNDGREIMVAGFNSRYGCIGLMSDIAREIEKDTKVFYAVLAADNNMSEEDE